MAKVRVFVSFDSTMNRHSRPSSSNRRSNPDSPFEVTDGSLKEAQPQREWEGEGLGLPSTAPTSSSWMLGSKTRSAPGVRKEVKMANELGKRKFQIIGYRDGSEDWAVPDGGRTYRWDWDNLRKLLAQ